MGECGRGHPGEPYEGSGPGRRSQTWVHCVREPHRARHGSRGLRGIGTREIGYLRPASHPPPHPKRPMHPTQRYRDPPWLYASSLSTMTLPHRPQRGRSPRNPIFWRGFLSDISMTTAHDTKMRWDMMRSTNLVLWRTGSYDGWRVCEVMSERERFGRGCEAP